MKLLEKRGVYISIKPRLLSGGGSNTFSWNMTKYLRKRGIEITRGLPFANRGIVIADKVNMASLWLAKRTGCLIIHRLDEHFEETETPARERKHARIRRINRYADVTVYQSEFVRENVMPHLPPKRWAVIINGADPSVFFDRGQERPYIGHVTNSVGEKKRLDLLEKAIAEHPLEQFLLVGNHDKSAIAFAKHKNVTMAGLAGRDDIAAYYQKMKCLYFPSENDPCPNTAVEAVMCGVPVCYNSIGGTKEIVRDCGLPLEEFEGLLGRLPEFSRRCRARADLYFDSVAEKYLSL